MRWTVKIKRGQKGDLIGYPFCLIDRRYQNLVKEGEEWRVELVRKIKDKRGKEIEIVKPLEKVYKIEGDKVYCGSIELGRAEIRTEKYYEKTYTYVVEVEKKEYIYNGEVIETKTERNIYDIYDLDEDIPTEARKLLEEIKIELERQNAEALEKDRASAEDEEYTKRKALERAKEVIKNWKAINTDTLIEEAIKTHEETKNLLEIDVYSKVRELYDIPANTKIELSSEEETNDYKERIYTVYLYVKDENGETLATETYKYQHQTTEYSGDYDGVVGIGVGVERDVIHTYITLDKSEKYDTLHTLYKKQNKLRKILPSLLASQERLIEKLKNDLPEIKRIQENIENEVVIGHIYGWYYVKYPLLETVNQIPTLQRDKLYYSLPDRYEDISEFGDLPVPLQMLEDRNFEYTQEETYKEVVSG